MPDDIRGQKPTTLVAKDNDKNRDRIQQQGDNSRQAREELIFDHDLNEVYLLVDFVSGRSDRSLSTLSINDPDDKNTSLTTSEVVRAISSMRYPTPPHEEVANARNAAILLLVKDQLSSVARPARSLTIAYTAMFVDAEAAWRSSWLRLLPDRIRKFFIIRSEIEHAVAEDSQVTLAQRTFPRYQEHADRFAAWRAP